MESKHNRKWYVLESGPLSILSPLPAHTGKSRFSVSIRNRRYHFCLRFGQNNLLKGSFGNTASKVWKQQTRFYWVCSWEIMADATSLTSSVWWIDSFIEKISTSIFSLCRQIVSSVLLNLENIPVNAVNIWFDLFHGFAPKCAMFILRVTHEREI